jgi:hypothetical protein
MATTNIDIKQIRIGDKFHEIDALKWGGHTFSEVEDLIHGVVDTYVIPTTKISTTGYNVVVGGTTTQVSTTVGTLKGLVSKQPSKEFKIGDVILMGATSDGKNNFDRWVSNVSGEGDTATITLDVLETQVATHHHTINVPTITSTPATVLTSAIVGGTTTSNMAYAGTAKTVVTGASNVDETVITSVDYADDGDFDLVISTGVSTDYGHTHTVDAHNHSVTYAKTKVSRTINVYTSLSTSSYTPHTHTVVSVAGKAESDGVITYATPTPQTSATFIKTLTDASTNTDTGAATPGTNGVSLTTSVQVSTDTIGDIVKTTSSGSHTHTVTTETDNNIVTAASVAAKVVTSVSYSAAQTVTSWVASVNPSGVLSFTAPIEDRVSIVSVTSAEQSRTLGKATSTGSAANAGGHQHGFSHTHSIAAHSHTVESHTHTYRKTVASESEYAITSLNSGTFNAHKHTIMSVAVASTSTSDSEISYVYGGVTATVVSDLTTETVSATVGNATPGIHTVYQKITGTITHPGINATPKKLSLMLSTGTVTPAVNSGQKPVMSITTTSAKVVGNISVTPNEVKTSPNEGGE